jgi:imidazolonepropionase-like amidohydrolase
VLAAACSHATPLVSRAPGAGRSVVVRNVRVFDAREGTLVARLQDVVARDGRIAAIEPPSVAAPGAVEVDGRGGTLLPGLIDIHTHTGSTPRPPWQVGALPDIDDNLGAFLYAGVTTVLDLGNLTPAIFRTRERVTSGALLGPTLYAAGPVFTAPGGHPAEVLRAWLPWYLRWYVLPRATREVAQPDEARRAVELLLVEHPNVLKIAVDTGAEGTVPRLDPATIAAIVGAGHAAGVRSIAHIGSSGEAIDVVRGGVDALAHSPWREPISDEAVAVIAAAHVPVVPTLTIWDAASAPRSGPADFLPIEREVAHREDLAALLAPFPALDPETAAFVRVAAAAHEARRQNVAKLRAAGVPLLVGSDGCNAGQFPGAGLHRELAALVQAGLPPGEALRAATWENARFLGGEGADFGEISLGKRADLVLVDGDPTADISALGRISRVILGGTVLERHARP